MTLTFYPHSEDTQKGSLQERVEILMEAAERYRTTVVDGSASSTGAESGVVRRTVPRDLTITYNWDEIARLLRQIRELPETNKGDKTKKGDLLAKLAEVYEVLRAAKMPKLEAVRLALVGEANQLRGTNSQQVA